MVRGDMNYAGRLVSVCEMEMVRADLPVGRQARTMDFGDFWGRHEPWKMDYAGKICS